MKNFSSLRREILRAGSFGLAGSAFPASAAFAQAGAGSANAGDGGPLLGVFDVRRYGATGDGKTLDTKAINSAIEAAAGAGGGVVTFPSGQYLSFSIRLKSQVRRSLLPIPPSPARPRDTTAGPMTPPNRRPTGTPTRITGTITGTTR